MKVYKKDTSGKIRFLEVFADGDELVQRSGVVDGKVVERRSTSKPKNVGKANATTAAEQAIKEAKSKIETKRSQGYFDNIGKASISEVILPMLAKDFFKEKKKVDWTTAYAQPKLDGMRALGHGDKFVSRKGKDIDTINHISCDYHKYIDGELYAHGKTFQENMKFIKKYRKGETELVKFNVYDLISDSPFSTRYEALKTITKDNPNIEIVPTLKCLSEEHLKELHDKWVLEGYEGAILRWGDEGYKLNGRSSNLLKYKKFIDETYSVIDVEPSDKNPLQGVIVCEMKDGITFNCGMKFSHAEREEILKNKEEYIGQTAEVRFFEYTDDGLPRFPVCVGFRLDK